MSEPPLLPYPEQVIDAQNIAMHSSTLLALPMGMGKSLIAVDAMQFAGARKILIVAPKNTFRSWKRMVERQSNYVFRPIDSSRSGKSAENVLLANLPLVGSYVWIVSWEMFRTKPMGHWKNVKVDFIVLDEVHRMANRKSKTWKQVQTLDAPHKLAMSGTPNGNRIEGFWTTLRWLWPDITPRSFWRWAHQWLNVSTNPVLGFTEIKGEQNPGALLASQPHYIWREDTKSYPLAEVDLISHMRPAQKKLYTQLNRELVVMLQNDPLIIEVPMHLRMRLRSITLGVPIISPDGKLSYEEDTESGALDDLMDYMENTHPDGETLLVFTHSRDFALVTAIRLYKAGFPAYAWVGGRPQKERDEVIANWGTPEGVQVIVAVVEAIAEGTDGLQDKCHHEYWLSESENPMINEQARKRLPRDGQKHTVTRVRSLVPDTYDEKVFDKGVQKRLELNQTLRGKVAP